MYSATLVRPVFAPVIFIWWTLIYTRDLGILNTYLHTKKKKFLDQGFQKLSEWMSV